MDIGSILSQIIVAIATGLIAAYFSYRKAREDAEIKLLNTIDESTAKERLEAYKVLWKKMKPLPQYPRPEKVTYRTLKMLNEDFRDWYFYIGGVYLTKESKDLYLDAQEQLYNLWKPHEQSLDDEIKEPKQKSDEIPEKPGEKEPDEYETARKKLSDLRNQLAEDLRSRLPPGA